MLDVGVDLVEALLVGLELVGLQGGVDQQLGLLGQGAACGKCQPQAGDDREAMDAHAVLLQERM
jgi:hypothetical protein